MLTWQFSRFENLSLHDWYAVSTLRTDVFVVEQNCPFQDNDGADPHSWHLLGWEEIDGRRELVAYCRLVDAGIKYAEPSIGRVVTARAVRMKGYGRILLAEALARHAALFPGRGNRIGAQQRLEKFYQAFGFETVSDVYIEDDIPHLEMLKKTN
ncbi:MAG TPA: GNAT family N-acetyltransferase [Usitatibacteraceae bacterium]